MREPKGTEYEEAMGHPLEDDLPCYREREVAVMPPSIWWCLNDHTGCLWNDGHKQISERFRSQGLPASEA